MPLYDCVLLLKPTVDRGSVVTVMNRLGRLVCAHHGVITDIKSFGTIHLAYSVKKLSERFSQVFHPSLSLLLWYVLLRFSAIVLLCIRSNSSLMPSFPADVAMCV
jgi:ribosomal protein S6